METMTLLPWLLLALLILALPLVGAYIIVRTHLQGAQAALVAEVRSQVPDAERLIKDLHVERARAAGTIRKARRQAEAPPDDDDLLHALDHPLARGIARGAGIDVDKLKAGDSEELAKLQGIAKGGHGKRRNYI